MSSRFNISDRFKSACALDLIKISFLIKTPVIHVNITIKISPNCNAVDEKISAEELSFKPWNPAVKSENYATQ